MATIQSELGAPKSNWDVLLEDLHGDEFLVVANRMNPRNGGMIQTRERLYQVWYNHRNAKRHDKNVIEDRLVQFRAVDCDNHMVYLNNHMGLALKLNHFILPDTDPRVRLNTARLSAEVEAKLTQANKRAAKGGAAISKRMKIDEDEAEEEEEGSNKKQPKWHGVHEQIWNTMFHGNAELGDIKWSLLAAQTIPARYQGNPCFEHMAIRNRDIIRMMDLKFPPEQLTAEIVVDLYPMRVLCFSSRQHL